MNTTARTIDFWTPQFGRVERGLLDEVLESSFINEGELTARFERELAALLGVRHAVTTTSGTTALFAALCACGVGAGDEVIVPDVTFIATANAVTMAGATSVLVDVDPDTLTMCPAAAERAITARTRAIIPVHVSGRAADMTALLDIARRHGLRVVEDAAEALTSRFDEHRCLGTLGDAGCFSFSPNKLITTGQGGAVVTNDDALACRLRELKDQGRRAKGTGGDDTHFAVGFNLKFTNLQAAVGLGQLELLPARVRRMRELYRLYLARLRYVEDVRFFGFSDAYETPLWIDMLAARREDLDAHLRAHGIRGRRFWNPLHTQAPYRREDADFPVSTRLASCAFWLPSSFLLRNDDVARVCEAIAEFYLAEFAGGFAGGGMTGINGARFLVTGGTGFIGAALVRRLVREGATVRVLDNNWRGAFARLADVQERVEIIDGDIRDPAAVKRAVEGMEHVFHLASINGTAHFYDRPDLVLDVGIRGMLNILDAIEQNKGSCPLYTDPLYSDKGDSDKGDTTLYIASSSEVYQWPPSVPTDERVGLSIPDPLNPRYSYAAAKIASEVMALHWAARRVERVVVFRPHNVYGPDMGMEHVVPQFALRMIELSRQTQGVIDFPIEGTGRETRAFVHIDDTIDGLMCLIERGEGGHIYHVGTEDEMDVATLAQEVARCFEREIRVVPSGAARAGGTPRRCPDIGKLRALGYRPRVSLRKGLDQTVRWYRDNFDGRGCPRRAA